MATVTTTPTQLTVSFTRGEKIGGLVRNFTVDRSSVADVEVVEDGLSAAQGIRAPGLGLPGLRKIGTWRRRGSKSLVSVRRGQPALRIRLAEAAYDVLVVGADDADRIAQELRASV